jgi:hypothetical protein
MKKIIYILGIACFFMTFTGFNVPPATVTDQHFDFPGPYELTNQCTGETVTVDGIIGDDIHIVVNDQRVNFSEHQQGQLEGIGNLGNRYITNVNENVTFNGLMSNGSFVINDITVFRMVSQGGAPNFYVSRNAHLTVTPNGVVTVDRVDFITSCN